MVQAAALQAELQLLLKKNGTTNGKSDGPITADHIFTSVVLKVSVWTCMHCVFSNFQDITSMAVFWEACNDLMAAAHDLFKIEGNMAVLGRVR